MGLFGKGNTMNMTHDEGLPGFGKGFATAMTLDEENRCLVFTARAFKSTNPVRLPLDKVKKAGNVNITEIEKQSKIRRAVVGGLLFGGAGAIVGAMSAGEKKKIQTMYIINYTSEGTDKVIVLHSNGSNLNFFGFQKRLEAYLPKSEPKPQGEIILGDSPDRLSDGELPFGWVTHHQDFVQKIQSQHMYFINQWINAEPNTKEKYAALKSLILFLYDAKKLCLEKGECYEKWFEEMIADDSYFSKREKELSELKAVL